MALLEVEGTDRSASFTQFATGASQQLGNKHVDYYNAEGRRRLTRNEAQRAREHSRSGRVGAIIPVKDELRHGQKYPGVLDYFEEALGDPRRILVVDADSTDGSLKEAANRGIPVVTQSEIESSLHSDEVARDFGVDIPLMPGKGKTLFNAALLYSFLTTHAGDYRYFSNPGMVQESDSDIKSIWRFDPATWFSWVQRQSNDNPYMMIVAAQIKRNNQNVMDAVTSRMGKNPDFDKDAKVFQEYKWPLSGQRRMTPELLRNLPGITGYSVETQQDLADIAYAQLVNGRIAQVEILARCSDGKNDDWKEGVMMGSISTVLDEVYDNVYSQGYNLLTLPPEGYRNLNESLRRREAGHNANGYQVSVISNNPGPNHIIASRLDQFVPSPAYLEKERYVDSGRLAHIAQRLYGRVWSKPEYRQPLSREIQHTTHGVLYRAGL